MIESCDTEIAGWDEDGLTFTVKDPVKFETKIIPQFFKHSKFSSFVRVRCIDIILFSGQAYVSLTFVVRSPTSPIPAVHPNQQQLNFYSFRKIKYGDSIRIDVETEKKTANYWRFKHENFRQGRPDLLTEIKRMNGKVPNDSSTTTKLGPGSSPATLVPDTVLSVHGNNTGSKGVAIVQVAEKSEVLKLKKRIDEMTKNIDKLTEMVQKVTFQHGDEGLDDETKPGSKRKKATQKENQSDAAAFAMDLPMPDEAYSSPLMDFEDLMSMHPSSTELMISSPDDVLSASSSSAFLLPPPSLPLSRESSSDMEFVDQLFTAFHEDEDVADWLIAHNDQTMNVDDTFGLPNEGNRPDPELMRRLSDALQLLPYEIQEMIVNRLIEAITSTEGLDLPIVTDSPTIATPISVMAPVVPKNDFKKVASAAKSSSQQQPLPLAAATLAALLHHYSNQIKESSSSSQPTKLQASKKNINTLPVIPVHA
jgi:HSF-type DNA-binding